jgi:hypothetical protein
MSTLVTFVTYAVTDLTHNEPLIARKYNLFFLLSQ